jgi:NADH:ubiquinone oxidoreductase subunit 5 (subunit L)/multisubunit Na+/H+ antiporter MnhA subunit
MTILAALVILAPFAAAWIGMLGGRRLLLGPGGVAVIGTAASTVMALVVLAGVAGDASHVRESWIQLTRTGSIPITAGVRVDGLSASVALMVTVVALAVQVYSIGYLRGDARYSSYAAFVSLFTAAMLLVVFPGDLMVLYVGWEIMGVCSYFLIGHHWEDPGAREPRRTDSVCSTMPAMPARRYGWRRLGGQRVPPVEARHLLPGGEHRSITNAAGSAGPKERPAGWCCPLPSSRRW